MATKAVNVQAIENALGEPWATTRARLEVAGGSSASHKELADALYPQFDGVVEKHGWWVQGAVVAYEQEIGRRVPGQRADGTFDVAVSRTVNGDRDDVITRFAFLVDQGPLAGVAIDGEPRTSKTDKRSFWRANLEDGTRFEAAAEPKSEGRTRLVLTISELPSAEALEDRRTHLKELLSQL
ncbi:MULTISPECIES: hypothetical protein [Brevibacterium]|uniref:Uncharacterized protein n=1 Tax=Brevibacterium antiquum CNRZ 918 TaxID=1255637 RepID=A0A2H1J0R1_9MICO|nr:MULTISPECIES: hypothetical protein [Brevibacterium]SMX81004.1 hypothetical protein BANT918_01295 [Brevibacterium antiquum CNRZ 918]HCG55274.1 hypothetical protein [Brevibacterium sp.]